MIEKGYAEYEGEERRKLCEDVIILKAQSEEDRKSRDAFRDYVIASLRELKESIKPLEEINTSYTRGKWLIGIAIIAATGTMVTMIIRWFERHWN